MAVAVAVPFGSIALDPFISASSNFATAVASAA